MCAVDGINQTKLGFFVLHRKLDFFHSFEHAVQILFRKRTPIVVSGLRFVIHIHKSDGKSLVTFVEVRLVTGIQKAEPRIGGKRIQLHFLVNIGVERTGVRARLEAFCPFVQHCERTQKVPVPITLFRAVKQGFVAEIKF